MKHTTLLPIISILFIQSALAETNLQINKIIVGPQASDPKDDFSLVINLYNKANDINDWQLGFYMPRSFRQYNKSNKNLVMQICETESLGNCQTLKYLKSNFADNDLSTVFTTIVAPIQNFTLKQDTKYTLSLLHNSANTPMNYSSLPQSFFLVSNGKIASLYTDASMYTITNYDNRKTNKLIESHILQNWQNSNTTTTLLNVIPQPQSIILSQESTTFDIRQNLALENQAELSPTQLNFWQTALENDFKTNVKISNGNIATGIKFINQKQDNPEGYNIQIQKNQILVYASTDAGFFYALQTLRQLWNNNPQLPLANISDYPRYKYRGIMLDVARHFFTIDEIKNFIDIMAANKLNTLHLHLSDNEAFRLALPAYPELQSVAAIRGYGQLNGAMSMIQQNLSQAKSASSQADKTYSGSYSPEQIKELITYANARQISIIPEIDIPGHSRAMMKALPEAFYESQDTSIYSGFGDNSIPICAYQADTILGKKFTSTIEEILTTVAHLFSGQKTIYALDNEINIGGDEVSKNTWDNAPSCNKFPWKKMDAISKEHYFINLLSDNLRKKGIKVSGWHEFILDDDGSIDKNSASPSDVGRVFAWGNYKTTKPFAVTLANNNYPTVLLYADNTYFDMTYTPLVSENGFYWATTFGDTKAALLSAVLANNTESSTKKPNNIIGLEGAIWADVIPDYHQLQYMAMPKIAGLAEAAWSNPAVTTANNMPNWRSLAYRLGCGESGFLWYLHQLYNVNYRGYPHGISQEAPMVCH